MLWQVLIVALSCWLNPGRALLESGNDLDRGNNVLLSLQDVKSDCSGLRSAADWSALGPLDSKGILLLESACHWVERLQVPDLLEQHESRYLAEDLAQNEIYWWGDSNDVHYPLVSMLILGFVCAILIFFMEKCWLKSTIFKIKLNLPEIQLPDINSYFHDGSANSTPEEKKKIEASIKLGEELGQTEIMGIVDKLCAAITEEPVKSDVPVVRFKKRVYYANVHDGKAVIEVDLIGKCDTEVKVMVKTASRKDKSFAAEAGKSYEHTEVELVFKPGDKTQSLEVPVLNTFCWTTMKWFVMELGPITSGAAELYPQGHARVFVVDDDLYPGSITQEQMGKNFFGSKRWTLAYYLMKECVAFRKEKFWKTLWAMLYPPFHSVVVQTLVQKCIISFVVSREFTTSDYNGAMIEIVVLALIHFLSVCLYRWADVVQTRNRGRTGGVRQTHRLHLLDKMLMIGHNQQMQYKGSTWLYAAVHDVDSLTMDVYWQFFVGVQAVESMILSFLLVVFWDFAKVQQKDDEYSISKLTPTISFVVIMPLITFLIWRRRKEVSSHVIARKDHEADWLNVFSWMAEVGHYMYGFGYRELSAIESMFKRQNKSFVKDHQITRDTMNDSVAIAIWLSTIAYLVILIWGGLALLAHEHSNEGINQSTVIDAGHYALLLSLFSKFGKYITKLHSCIVKLQRGTVSLERIQKLLNMADEARQESTRTIDVKAFDAGQNGIPDDRIVLDSVCLKVEDKKFGIGPFGQVFTKQGSRIELPLGRMVLVKSLREGRMLSILGMAAGVIPPHSGRVLCPQHVWRAMTPTAPVHSIGDLTCIDELKTTGATAEQAACLLTTLGIDPEHGSRHLPPGQVQLIVLLRALLRDPEVLVLAEPLAFVKKHRAADAIKLIRVWQAYGGARGLLQLCDKGELKEQSSAGKQRTVIISLIDVSHCVDTDHIIDLDEFWEDEKLDDGDQDDERRSYRL